MCALGPTWDTFVRGELAARAAAGLDRTLRPFARSAGSVETADGRTLRNFSSNDYLGLANHPVVIDAAAEAARARGAGAAASRLVTGTDPAVRALEGALAAHAGTEAALVFGSGYLANVGTIAALVSRDDAVVSDRLNHASIIDGCLLSGARHLRYRHGDVADLEAALHRARDGGARRVLIVTESIFSMDGDLAPLAEIVELKHRFDAALMVDEAHADGVTGPLGRGVAHAVGVAGDVDVHLATLSKAYGTYGAYVAADERLIAYLIGSARTFVFTTALPPAVIGAAHAALGLVERAETARTRLSAHADRLRAALLAQGWSTGESASQIVPALIGSAEAALAASAALERAGILAVAIRPPTVPRGTARLRFSLSAAHTDADVAALIDALATVEPPERTRVPGATGGGP